MRRNVIVLAGLLIVMLAVLAGCSGATGAEAAFQGDVILIGPTPVRIVEGYQYAVMVPPCDSDLEAELHMTCEADDNMALVAVGENFVEAIPDVETTSLLECNETTQYLAVGVYVPAWSAGFEYGTAWVWVEYRSTAVEIAARRVARTRRPTGRP